MRYAGQPLKRFEDPRMVTGRGAFVDDIQLPDMLYAAVTRSPHAHARISAIDTSAARHLPGGVGDVPTRAMRGGWEVAEMRPAEQPVLARGKVNYVGQPVAAPGQVAGSRLAAPPSLRWSSRPARNWRA
jgi:carbon-monoxide dehydrogenase large subunit